MFILLLIRGKIRFFAKVIRLSLFDDANIMQLHLIANDTALNIQCFCIN